MNHYRDSDGESPEGEHAIEAAAGEIPGLLTHHAKLIQDSAITADVARARGYRSVTKGEDLRWLGFNMAQQRLVPSLLIPIHNVRGEITTYQIRPDIPREIN